MPLITFHTFVKDAPAGSACPFQISDQVTNFPVGSTGYAVFRREIVPGCTRQPGTPLGFFRWMHWENNAWAVRFEWRTPQTYRWLTYSYLPNLAEGRWRVVFGADNGTETTEAQFTVGNVPPEASGIDQERKERQAADQSLGQQISDAIGSFTGKFARIDEYLMDILSHAEEEAKAWRTGILDLEGRLKAWFADQVLELLLKKLTEGRKNVHR